MLANLGLYGKVFDELQNQVENARKTIDRARKEAPKTNKGLVKRGESLIKDVQKIVQGADVPTSKGLEKQIDKLRASIRKLRKRVA